VYLDIELAVKDEFRSAVDTTVDVSDTHWRTPCRQNHTLTLAYWQTNIFNTLDNARAMSSPFSVFFCFCFTTSLYIGLGVTAELFECCCVKKVLRKIIARNVNIGTYLLK